MLKIALVTGASAGFDKVIAEKLVLDGYRVIASTRCLEKLQSLQAALGKQNVYPLQIDISQTQTIGEAPAFLPKEWRETDILVNDANLALGPDKAHEADFLDWLIMINTDIAGLTYLTYQILSDMAKRNIGVIINLGSVTDTVPYPGANVCRASEAFVKQFSLNLRAGLTGTKVQVTNIEPGLYEGTEFPNVRFKGDNECTEKPHGGVHAIRPENIANTASWVASQPSHVNINCVEIAPVSQSFGPQPVHRDQKRAIQLFLPFL